MFLEGEDILWRKTAIILKLTAKISKTQEKKSISSLLKRIGTNCESLKTSKQYFVDIEEDYCFGRET